MDRGGVERLYVNVRRVVRMWTKGERLKAAMAMESGGCGGGSWLPVLLFCAGSGVGVRAAMMAASSVNSSYVVADEPGVCPLSVGLLSSLHRR